MDTMTMKKNNKRYIKSRNMFGPLSQDIMDRLNAVIDNPTQKTWDDAHCIIIGADGWMTLWQAVIAIDPTFPHTGKCTDEKGKVLEPWPRIPDTFTLRRAIKHAQESK